MGVVRAGRYTSSADSGRLAAYGRVRYGPEVPCRLNRPTPLTRIGTTGSLYPDYLAQLLNLWQRQKVCFRFGTNWNNQAGVNNGVLSGLPISILSIDQQAAIAQLLTELRSSAKKLRQEAKDELEKARQDVE